MLGRHWLYQVAPKALLDRGWHQSPERGSVGSLEGSVGFPPPLRRKMLRAPPWSTHFARGLATGFPSLRSVTTAPPSARGLLRGGGKGGLGRRARSLGEGRPWSRAPGGGPRRGSPGADLGGDGRNSPTPGEGGRWGAALCGLITRDGPSAREVLPLSGASRYPPWFIDDGVMKDSRVLSRSHDSTPRGDNESEPNS